MNVKMIRTGTEYVDSLRKRNLDVWLFGERVDEPVDHPAIGGIFDSYGSGRYTLRPEHKH